MNVQREIRFAARALVRQPGFTSGTVLTLALAIGACTTIFSVVYSVLLQPLPYPNPDRLVQVWQVGASGGQGQFSDPNFEDLRDQSRAFAAFAEHADGMSTVMAGAAPLRARVATVSGQFFDVFQTPPERGRTFLIADLHEGAAPVTVVSHGFWQRILGGTPDLDAVRLRIGDRPHVVVGVMPRRFNFPEDVDIWTPREQQTRNPYRTGHNWRAVGRLAPGVAVGAAQADVTAVARRLKAVLGDQTAMADVVLVPLREQMTGPVKRPLTVLFASVGCLVAIACANLTNLLLVRISGRRRELAVRSALGAGRVALIAPLIAEIALITAAGGALGLALSAIGPRALGALNPGTLPRLAEVGIHWPVVLFAFGITAGATVFLGLAAAWRAHRAEAVDWLQQAQRGYTGSAASGRLRNGLVVAQLACALVLLVGAGLLGRSLALLFDQNPGFRTDDVLTIDLSSAPAQSPDALPRLAQFHEQLMERLGALPGVAGAGGVNRFPMGTGYANGTFIVAAANETFEDLAALGPLFRDPARSGQAEFRVASPGYFTVMGIPLVRGRLFDTRDTAEAPHAAVISESLARARWAGADPIGARIQFGNMDGNLRVFTVVGIVGDILERGLNSAPRPTFYADYRQRPRATSSFTVVLRTTAAPDVLTGAVRKAVADLDSTVALRFRTVDQVVAASVADRRFAAILIGAFATSALLLAIVGIYGVLSYAVSQRLKEFGVRLALGAQASDVRRLVLRQAAALVIAGAAIGLAAAWGSTRLMQSMLFGITPTDPLTFGGVTGTLAVTALVAALWPAIRATRVDPLSALRAE